MKKLLYFFQTLFMIVACFCFYCAGEMYAEDYSWNHSKLFLEIIIKLCIIGGVFLLGSIALHFIRLKKYGYFSRRPMISGIPILLLMLLTFIWFIWILFFVPLSDCFPSLIDERRIDYLPYHGIAVGIVFAVQLNYFLICYFTEKKSVSRENQARLD